MSKIGFYACLLSSLPLVGACEFSPAGPAAPSALTATVTGATVEGPIAASYTGTGYFTTTTARRPAAPPLFILSSDGTGDARDLGFQLSKRGTARPAAGRHALGPAGDQLQMVFVQRRGNVSDRYAAQSGWVEISHSTDERITGTFSFRGAFIGTCTSSGSSSSCSLTASPAPDAPAVDVEGSFDAVPRR